jgi:subtilisin family serine protease
VGIIFATGSEAEASQAAFASLLSGPAADARWAGLRLFPLLDHGAARVGPQALLQLIGSDRIQRIELDVIHRPVLAASVPRIRADLAHQIEADGDGQTLAILDTGIDPDHPMLAGRIVDEACFSLDRDCPNEQSEMLGPGAGAPCAFDCGHGTRVAGIAAGDDPEGRLVGVAPRAQLISIQVFSDIDGAPGAYASDVLAGLQHVLALTAYYEIAAVNLSLASERLFTSSQSCDAASASQRLAIERLREGGVASVAAAGNDGQSDLLAAPACLSNVISVGSSSLRDRLSGFSNSASFLSLLAPGEGIESSRQGGGTGVSSGTSMATAHVAGAIALLREATPSATVGELENALGLTGVPIRIPGGDLSVPRIDVEAARALLTATIDPDPAPVGTEQEDGTGDGFSGAAAPSGGGGGGGGCGLIGLEPFAMLFLLRRLPRMRPRPILKTRGSATTSASS